MTRRCSAKWRARRWTFEHVRAAPGEPQSCMIVRCTWGDTVNVGVSRLVVAQR